MRTLSIVELASDNYPDRSRLTSYSKPLLYQVATSVQTREADSCVSPRNPAEAGDATIDSSVTTIVVSLDESAVVKKNHSIA